MKVTINPSLGTNLEVSQWTINREKFTEPERVSVEKDNRHYSIVLTDGNPIMEVWTVNPDGELGQCINTFEIEAGLDEDFGNS